MPSRVKHNVTDNHRGFELHKSDDPHFRLLRAISSGKAQNIFQTKLKDGYELYTSMGILYKDHVSGTSGYVTGKCRSRDKILCNR